MTYNVYIMLSMSGTRFSKFLRFFSHLEFTHVSISFDKDLKTLYSFARKNYYMPWIAGFVEEYPNAGILGKFDPTCEILELELTERQYKDLKIEINDFKINQKIYGYNFLGLIFAYFNIPHRLNYNYTCTQFVAKVLSDNGLLVALNKDVSLIRPNDYYNIPNIKSCYKGKLHNYQSA